jgi:DNA-binding SARP family transcriptional activator
MPDVTFSVLGSVEVNVGDRAAALGGGRQRALLAALLLSADRVVSVDRLVDELWGERPPSSARTQVHTLVHRVRRALGEAAELLETRPPGYLLRTRPAQLDLAAFTELGERARAHAAAGRLAEAADAFREALGIWRGPALDGADGAFVPREAARLEEMRLAAVEQCLAVELDLGRHGAIVAELASLVGEHPLREETAGRADAGPLPLRQAFGSAPGLPRRADAADRGNRPGTGRKAPRSPRGDPQRRDGTLARGTETAAGPA